MKRIKRLAKERIRKVYQGEKRIERLAKERISKVVTTTRERRG